MALTKYRLINTRGLSLLDTPAGRFRLEHIDDKVAAQLHAQGSRYVEPVPAKAPKATKPAK